MVHERTPEPQAHGDAHFNKMNKSNSTCVRQKKQTKEEKSEGN